MITLNQPYFLWGIYSTVKGYPYKSIYFDGVKFAISPKDAPAWEQTTKAGKTVWNRDAQDEWYYQKAEEGIEAFLSTKPNNNTTQKQEEFYGGNTKPQSSVVDDEDFDNLPF